MWVLGWADGGASLYLSWHQNHQMKNEVDVNNDSQISITVHWLELLRFFIIYGM